MSDNKKYLIGSHLQVKFSPLNLNDYQARLLCHIPNTEDGRVGPMVACKGRALLPYCHVELEESDYIAAGRRDPEMPGPGGAASGLGLEPMTKVLICILRDEYLIFL